MLVVEMRKQYSIKQVCQLTNNNNMLNLSQWNFKGMEFFRGLWLL